MAERPPGAWLALCLAAVVVAAALLVPPSRPAWADPDPLPRIASVGLCSDHYVLILAAPEQIASLSAQATGPLSPHRDLAARFPANRANAEEMLMLDVDIVVMDDFRTFALARMLERRGIPFVRVNTVATLDGVRDTLLEVGRAIGREETAQAVVADLDARLAQAHALAPPPELAAYLRPDGGSAGHDTFVDDVMRHAGLRNLAAELGHHGWGRLTLEALVLSPPDVLVTSFFDMNRQSLSGRFAHHAVFRRLLADTPVLQVPGSYWPCGSPHLIDAVEALVAR